MALPELKLYLVRFTLPDGPHIAAHRTPHAWRTDEDKAQVIADVKQHLSQNPDAVLQENGVQPVNSYDEIIAAARDLKTQNPERPLAHEMGLDTPNRLLTNPEIAQAHVPTPDA